MKINKSVIAKIIIALVIIAGICAIIALKMQNKLPVMPTEQEMVTGIPTKILDEATQGFSESDDLASIEKDLSAIQVEDTQ